MISRYEEKKMVEEMREWMGGNIIIPDNVSPYSISRKRIKIISKKESTKKKERVNIVASIGRIIGNLVRK